MRAYRLGVSEAEENGCVWGTTREVILKSQPLFIYLFLVFFRIQSKAIQSSYASGHWHLHSDLSFRYIFWAAGENKAERGEEDLHSDGKNTLEPRWLSTNCSWSNRSYGHDTSLFITSPYSSESFIVNDCKEITDIWFSPGPVVFQMSFAGDPFLFPTIGRDYQTNFRLGKPVSAIWRKKKRKGKKKKHSKVFLKSWNSDFKDSLGFGFHLHTAYHMHLSVRIVLESFFFCCWCVLLHLIRY